MPKWTRKIRAEVLGTEQPGKMSERSKKPDSGPKHSHSHRASPYRVHLGPRYLLSHRLLCPSLMAPATRRKVIIVNNNLIPASTKRGWHMP